MFDENVRKETVCCLRAAAGSFYLKKNTRHNCERYLRPCVYLSGPGIRWSVSWWDQPPLYVWIHSEVGLFSSSACRDSPLRSDPRVPTIYPGLRNCLKKILNICRKINRIYRHDHPTLNLDLLHLASVPSYPHPEYLRSSTPSQPDRNQSPGPHHRCKAFLIGSSLLNGREEVFSWLLSGKSPQDWPENGEIRIIGTDLTNCRPESKESGMMNSPFVRIFMHLWRRFDQTAVNEEFYQGTLSQAWIISK